METYSLLREFADSWFLIAMFAFFLGASIFAFWPSLKSARDDAASIPLRDDAASVTLRDETAGCSNDCKSCRCKTLLKLEPTNG